MVMAKWMETGKRLSVYGFLSLVALLTIGPFLLILNTSLRTTKSIVKDGPLVLPKVWQWSNYSKIWEVGHFATYFKNSVIVALIVVVSTIVVSVLAAYAFSYMKFWGKEMLFLLILFGLVVPMELVIIPLFYNLKDAGLLNTRTGLIFPQIAMGIPFAVFLIRGFMRDIPGVLLESARIDGAGELRSLFQIIVPLISPVVVAVTIFTILGTWNSFMLPTILIRDEDLMTLPLGLNYFRTKFTMDFAMIATSAIISAVPTVLAYVFFQRTIISGMVAGAVKE